MTDQIRKMLADAYHHLGICDQKENDRLVEASIHYLSKDREHYIEIAEEEQPEYLATHDQGVICKLIPLARSVVTDRTRVYREVFTATLYLAVTEKRADYVHAYTKDKLYKDPKRNSHTYPFYRYTQLSKLANDLKPLPPEQIEPIATPRSWQIFCMAFAAYVKFCKDRHINFIPLHAEQVMEQVRHAPNETFTIDNATYSGKAIPLVYSRFFANPIQRDGHTHIWQKLYLLISAGTPRYMLQTIRNDMPFQSASAQDDDALSTDTGKQTQSTYAFVELEDVPPPMNPY